MSVGKRKRSVKKKLLIALLSVAIFAVSVLGVLQLGVWYTANHWQQWRPSYEKIDILPLLWKDERTEEDYDVLYRQTGLTKTGIDGLLNRGNVSRILRIQTAFFEEYEITPDHFAAFTFIEKIDGNVPLAKLEDGDILVSASTRVSWFRYGHAAIVVDADDMLIAEAVAVGEDSWIASAYSFDHLANFIVLRPNLSEAKRKQAARYAKENLVGIPYRLTTGVLSKKFQQPIQGSQCAHLVWYAYKQVGVDLDSTGGGVVKPRDIAKSPHVSVVQAFGFDLDTLWR